MARRYLPGLLLLLWLGGCAIAPRPAHVSGKPDPQLQEQLQAMQHWRMEGKLAVQTSTDSHSARIQWQQQDNGFDIHLSGPAGLKATRIYGMPGGVVFEQGDRIEHAGSAEDLSQKLIGWPLPAEQLTRWLRGLPAAALPVTSASYTPEGWLAELEQDGWTIRFSQHAHQGAVVLPGRIEASHDDLRITLLAKQWVTSP